MDNYRSRQKQHLMEKYGHLRNKKNQSQAESVVSIELTEEEQKSLLSIVAKLKGGE